MCRIAATEPAPQFYISLEQAFKSYNTFRKHKRFPRHYSLLNILMYQEIFCKYEEALGNGKKGSRADKMQQVLFEPASSFYIKPETAMFYYYRAIRKRRKKR